MRKIIILNWVLKIFIRVQIIAIPIWEYMRYNLTSEQITWMYKDSIFGNFSHYIMLVRVTVLISGIVYIQKGLQAFIREGFFNFKSSKRFKIGGYLLSITSIFSIIVSLLNMKKSIKGEFSSIIMELLLLAIGIGLLALSDVIKKGNIIETENNLTI
jgi:hypothetical protein